MTVAPFTFHEAPAPLLVSIPHGGTYVPDDLLGRMTPAARTLPDTDWHLARLYGFLGDLGANVLAANWSRYVIDCNRPPDDTPLYPGAQGTGLCPTTLFDMTPVYEDGAEPDGAERADRLAKVWQPYHDALANTLARLKERHGYALLFDAHSIRSVVPTLFDGRLHDFNVGTNGGRAAAADLETAMATVYEAAPGYTTARNGRFKGGTITRRYGDPANHIHAVQLELAQATYMDEDHPFAYRDDLAARVQPVLRDALAAMVDWGRRTYG
jgi:formiminoglutamase